MKHFVSEPLEACRDDCHRDASIPQHRAASNDPDLVEGFSHEPSLPTAFHWRNETLAIKSVRDRRHSTKVDRGDTYLKRHWFDLETADGRVITVYYDRAAKRGHPHWWLYAIEE